MLLGVRKTVTAKKGIQDILHKAYSIRQDIDVRMPESTRTVGLDPWSVWHNSKTN